MSDKPTSPDAKAAEVEAAPWLIERQGPVLVLTHNRPHARNAMTLQIACALAAALDEFDSDPALAVAILTGAGGHFCAGMDLRAFLDGDAPEVPGRGFGGLTQAPPAKPLIAAVEGYALAGGCELVLACDLVVAARDATFGLPEVGLGLIAGSGGLLRLPHRIPRAVATELALTGDRFGADDAHRWGLVNRLVDPGTAREAAVELAGRVARNAPLALAATKRLLAATDLPAHEAWTRQQTELDAIKATDDAREGAQAFGERRTPRWTGR